MRFFQIDVKNKDSLPETKAYFYGQEDIKNVPIHSRPVIVICPGGGYEFTSDRETEIVALQFLAMGYHAAVLRYSCSPAVYPTALTELAALVREIHVHASEWQVDRDQLYLLGFSAGAHLVCSFSSFWKEGFLSNSLSCSIEQLKPAGQILCYPVIKTGEFAHNGSFRALLADEYEEKKEELSLEKRVSDAVPETFIWHTTDDASVPVQNSLLYVQALIEAGIPVEYHLFEHGRHGLSLGNLLTTREGDEVEKNAQPWLKLVHNWLSRRCGF